MDKRVVNRRALSRCLVDGASKSARGASTVHALTSDERARRTASRSSIPEPSDMDAPQRPCVWRHSLMSGKQAGRLTSRERRCRCGRSLVRSSDRKQTPEVGTPVPVPLITGTIGSGKTTLVYEIGDLLSEMRRPQRRRPQARAIGWSTGVVPSTTWGVHASTTWRSMAALASSDASATIGPMGVRLM